MKTAVRLALAAALAALSVPALAAPGGGCRGGRSARLYDPTTVETTTGTVTALQSDAGPRGQGVHLQLQTAQGPVAVHLGPSWWLEKQAARVAVGDALEITGSRISYDGKPALIAKVVKAPAGELALRDADGAPAWAGKGAGPGPRAAR